MHINRPTIAVVALRKESVDRNVWLVGLIFSFLVALRKESVDRNNTVQVVIVIMHASLSVRRAWIEMSKKLNRTPPLTVALRKESVDRNNDTSEKKKINPARSLSVRRAWIEIRCPCRSVWLLAVALRKESVDRNRKLLHPS